jgi:hypothetical protein
MAPKSLLGWEDALALVIVKKEKDFNRPSRLLVETSIETCIG